MSRSLQLVQRQVRKLVLDTSVIVSALRSPDGSSAELLLLCLAKEYIAVVTPALLFEYEAVLYRPEHGLSREVISSLVAEIADSFSPARIDFNWRPQLRDPDDELVLEAALNGQAEVIVTHNLRDFLPESLRFGVQVLTPGAIIRSRRL